MKGYDDNQTSEKLLQGFRMLPCVEVACVVMKVVLHVDLLFSQNATNSETV